MNNKTLGFFILCFIVSCSDSMNGTENDLNPLQGIDKTDDDFRLTNIVNDTSNIGTPQNTTKQGLAYFFDIKKSVDSLNQLIFFKNDDSLIRWDDNEKDWTAPIRWISIEEYELQRSTLINQSTFSVLVLDNPAESSVDLFYKQSGKKVDKMIEDKHFPDSVIFHQLNDTLLICQYYWEYDFGSDLSDIRTYYFIGAKMGIFKYGYSTTGIKLNLEDFIPKDEGMSFEDNQNGISLLVLPDTLHQLKEPKETKKVSVFKPYFIHFENVTFSE
ncbi:MAG: hypothetical protein H6599_01185 [Flavobacteriales bacterium]|nr:hypothetical protein [Flavobacteriales bacterium]